MARVKRDQFCGVFLQDGDQQGLRRVTACFMDAMNAVGSGLFPPFGSPAMPHKYNAERRHHVPRPKRRVTN